MVLLDVGEKKIIVVNLLMFLKVRVYGVFVFYEVRVSFYDGILVFLCLISSFCFLGFILVRLRIFCFLILVFLYFFVLKWIYYNVNRIYGILFVEKVIRISGVRL